MMKPTIRPAAKFAGLIPFLAIASSAAVWAGQVYTITDRGVPRQYEIADDEVAVSRPGARDIGSRVKTAVPEATLIRDTGTTAVARFNGSWRTALGDKPIMGAKFSPVAYEAGAPRTHSTRRVITTSVLAKTSAALDKAALLRESGAASAKETIAPGYVMLTFPTAEAALAGTEKLRLLGTSAEPQIRRQATKKLIPIDSPGAFDFLWHFQNTGQNNGVVGVDIGITRAWDAYTGNGINIAIVDDGIDMTHVDLVDNIPAIGVGGPHHDFNDVDDDPSADPFADPHGTPVAGIAAIRGNNGFYFTGAAFESNIIGLRLIAADNTDQDEADAFNWTGGGANIDVSNNSWGPPDDGNLERPGILASQALADATTTGRAGRGVVFVWAAGNGGEAADYANLDGYANSRFVIATGSVTNLGKRASYSETGPNILVAAPSNGGTLGITTADVTGPGGYNDGNTFGNFLNDDLTIDFGGTSAAAPMVSGVAALVIQANPALGWRDVKEIIASTATRVDSADASWTTNGAGFEFSTSYGGGLVNATTAVARAEDWVNLAAEATQERILGAPAVPATIPDNNPAGLVRDFNYTAGPNLRVETVEVQLDIGHTHRNDLEIVLTSPSGKESRLIERRARPAVGTDNDYTDGGLGWTFSTVQHWAENSTGTWRLTIRDLEPGTTGNLRQARMRIYGTPAGPQRFAFAKKLDFVAETQPSINITVNRLGDTVGAASVDYVFSNTSTATGGLDFTANAGAINFVDGQATANITVPITNDTATEGDERIYLMLKNPSTGALGGNTVMTVEIDDDEGNNVTITATDFDASETNTTQPKNLGTFTVTRSAVTFLPLTVDFTISGTAEIETDYLAIPTSVIIPAGQASATITIEPRNDNRTEALETVILTLVPRAAYNVGVPNQATVNINDNDLINVSVAASAPTVLENANTPVVFTITRETLDLSIPLNVFLRPTGTARNGIDYDPAFPSVVQIPPGSASTTVSVTPNDNEEFNPPKTIILSVSQTNTYKEGFFNSVDVRILDNDPIPDGKKPAVTIAAPTKNQRLNFPDAIVATGTATDNPDAMGGTGVAQVQYRINKGAWALATLTGNSWTADITTASAFGNNLLEVKSIDEDDNESPITGVPFVHVKQRNLTVNVTGPGTVTAEFTGTHALEVGQTYTLVAKPNSGGNLFAGWTGDILASARTLVVTLPDVDVTLNAAFSAPLFPEGILGNYVGLIQRTPFAGENSGHLQVLVGKTGGFTGTMIYGGKRYNLRGEFAGNGRYIAEIPRKNNTPLAINLQLDTDPAATRTITGNINADGIISNVLCNRALSKTEATAITAGIAGKFTFQIPSIGKPTILEPYGTGYGTLTLTPQGGITWSGVLPDGSKATQATFLSKDRTWPFFATYFEDRGTMLGVVTHDPAQLASDFAATVNWRKAQKNTDKLFPSGFSVEGLQIIGSAYLPPAPGVHALTSFASASGTLNITDGNLTTDINKMLSISNRNTTTITPVGADRLTVTISAANGTFKGTFIHPRTLKKVKIAGILLQKGQLGIGGFNGATRSGTALQTGTVSFSAPIVPVGP